MNQLYSKKVFKHFRNPHNMGELKDADGKAVVGNPVCGDVMRMFIKVGERGSGGRKIEYIKDIKFMTLGCAAAIATSSVMTDLAKGRSLDEAERLDNSDVAKALGGLPKVKLHCSVLAAEALRKAIDNYREKGKGKVKLKKG